MKGATLAALAALLLALASGCDVCEPNNAETDAPEDAEYAIQFAADQWAARLGVEAAELPPFRWFEGECLSWTYLPEPHDCTRGMYFVGTGPLTHQVQILADRPGAIWDTTVAHELLHWTLDRKGSPDPWHDGAEWDQVIEVRQAIYDSMHPTPEPVDPEPAPSGPHRRSGEGTLAQ